MNKGILIGAPAVAGLVLGLIVGNALFDDSAELADQEGKLKERDAKISTLEGDLGSAKKDVARLKGEIDSLKRDGASKLAEATGRATSAETARTKAVAEAKVLAEMAQAADRLRASELRYISVSRGFVKAMKAKRDSGWIDPTEAKALVEGLDSAVTDYRKWAQGYVERRKAAEAALTSQGASVSEFAPDDAILSVDKMAAWVSAAKDLFGSMEIKKATVIAKENWQASGVEVEEGDTVLLKADGTWSLGEYVGKAQASKGFPKAGYVKVVEKLPFGAAIGRIAESDVFWQAHTTTDRACVIADSSGVLEFLCNEEDRGNNDGKGEIQVLVLKKALVDACKAAAEGVAPSPDE